MRTAEIAALLLAALAGAALGAFFFGGLWWTVRTIVSSPRAGLVQFASLLVRMVVALLGFYAAGSGGLGRLLACTAGFVLARLVVARRVRRTSAAPIPEEARHAARP